jgi:hypothetical protein
MQLCFAIPFTGKKSVTDNDKVHHGFIQFNLHHTSLFLYNTFHWRYKSSTLSSVQYLIKMCSQRHVPFQQLYSSTHWGKDMASSTTKPGMIVKRKIPAPAGHQTPLIQFVALSLYWRRIPAQPSYLYLSLELQLSGNLTSKILFASLPLPTCTKPPGSHNYFNIWDVNMYKKC